MLKKLVLFSFVSVFSFDAFSSELREAQDIFAEPAKGGFTQILLGLSELGVARAVWPGMYTEEKALAEAEKKLALARTLPVTETEKLRKIEALANALSNVERSPVKVDLGTVVPSHPSLVERLQFLSANDIVTAEDKAARVAALEQEVIVRTQAALEKAQQMGWIERGVRFFRKIGSSLILADVAGRVYVWNVLEANPGLTPLGGYSAEQVRRLLE